MSETPSGARARASPGPAAAPSASPLHQGRRGPDLAAAAASSPGSRADRRTRPAGVGVAAAASPSSGCPRLPSAPHAAPAAATTAAGERCAQGACAVYVELGRAAYGRPERTRPVWTAAHACWAFSETGPSAARMLTCLQRGRWRGVGWGGAASAASLAGPPWGSAWNVQEGTGGARGMCRKGRVGPDALCALGA